MSFKFYFIFSVIDLQKAFCTLHCHTAACPIAGSLLRWLPFQFLKKLNCTLHCHFCNCLPFQFIFFNVVCLHIVTAGCSKGSTALSIIFFWKIALHCHCCSSNSWIGRGGWLQWGLKRSRKRRTAHHFQNCKHCCPIMSKFIHLFAQSNNKS